MEVHPFLIVMERIVVSLCIYLNLGLCLYILDYPSFFFHGGHFFYPYYGVFFFKLLLLTIYVLLLH